MSKTSILCLLAALSTPAAAQSPSYSDADRQVEINRSMADLVALHPGMRFICDGVDWYCTSGHWEIDRRPTSASSK